MSGDRKPLLPPVEALAKEICRRMVKDGLAAPPVELGRPPTDVVAALAFARAQGWLGNDLGLTDLGRAIGLRSRTGTKLKRRLLH